MIIIKILKNTIYLISTIFGTGAMQFLLRLVFLKYGHT